MKSNRFSFINFVSEIKDYIFNPNQKYIYWGANNDIPDTLLKLYDTVPEHSSAINFILSNVIENDIDEMDYWTLQKLALDYILFGGFAVEVVKLRNDKYQYNYKDISLLRLNPDKNKIGFAENWTNYKSEVEWFDKVDNLGETGIYLFKNPKTRGNYPSPRYISAFKSLDTMKEISSYHNNNAKNGFTPNVVINFNNGEPDDDTKKDIEKKLTEKFTGVNGSKFILSFNESEETKTTIEKLDNDNLDQKFKDLQVFLQNQIIISHQLTSGALIGVRQENTGFSAIEYEEAMEIFELNVISGYRKELEYGLTELFGTEIILKDSVEPVIEEEEINE